MTSLNTSITFQAGGSSALLMDLAANEKSVHADFYNGKMKLEKIMSIGHCSQLQSPYGQNKVLIQKGS